MRISSTKTNTVSKRTEARFHMTQIIKEFYQVRPNWFLSISYVPCKPCIYLASRLALSPKRPNWASTWAPWPRSTIGCVQNGFLSYGRCKLCTYLAPNKNIIPKRTEVRFHMTHVILEFHLVRPNWFLSIWYVSCKSCTYLPSRLALSLTQTEPSLQQVLQKWFLRRKPCT